MGPRAVVFGCGGPVLTAAEASFFAECRPWGFILFARNIETPDQVRRLTADLRASVGRDAPVLIDQEGGRVARLRPPAWREWAPALDECERLPSGEIRARAMHLRYRLIASELGAVGIDVNCAPVLDVVQPGTHPVIRNRCYGDDSAEVARVGRAVADGLLAGGVLPVMKHLPGQGRATLDSHRDVPRVAAGLDALQTDFAPFRALADLPLAMTGHVVFPALDPSAPATLSPTVVDYIRTSIGFRGLLLTDDLSMHALTGSFAERVGRALAAGCDVVLHCNGDAAEMAQVADAAPALTGLSAARAEAALALRHGNPDGDAGELEAEYASLGARAHA